MSLKSIFSLLKKKNKLSLSRFFSIFTICTLLIFPCFPGKACASDGGREKISDIVSRLERTLADLIERMKNPLSFPSFDALGEGSSESYKDFGDDFNWDEYREANKEADKEITGSATSEECESCGSGGGGGGGGSENGSKEKPYKIEPNQFKKVCGKDTYVLKWRIGGLKGRDMIDTIKKGGPLGNWVYWQLPTCQELADCHCCCNTCQIGRQDCLPGFCFLCFDPSCHLNCGPCTLNCMMPCYSYTSPASPGAENRDCKCTPAGCPKSTNCEIVIPDPGKSGVEYTTKSGKPEYYFRSAGSREARFKNGNGSSDPRSKVQTEGGDAQQHGFTGILTGAPGQCCKCTEDTGGAGQIKQGVKNMPSRYRNEELISRYIDELKEDSKGDIVDQGLFDSIFGHAGGGTSEQGNYDEPPAGTPEVGKEDYEYDENLDWVEELINENLGIKDLWDY